MEGYIKQFINEADQAINSVQAKEISRAINIVQSVYERGGRIYIFGNGGSLALATHWVSDFNKTVFSHDLEKHSRRFQAIRLPSTEEELSAWANDVGYDMVFAGPLQNYLQEADCIIAISSSGNSNNIIKAVELAKSRHIQVVGLSGFDGGKLNELADAKILVKTERGKYGIVEGAHAVILHLITTYFQDYFDHLQADKKSRLKKILFLDRDGVINKKAEEHEYVARVDDFIFNEKIFEVLRDHKKRGYEFIVITNQRGIARGKMLEKDLEKIHEHMIERLKRENLDILDIFYCPHEEFVCDCRKPKFGLLNKAADKYDIDLNGSILISDSWKDVKMGKEFGIGENIFVESDTLEILKYDEYNK